MRYKPRYKVGDIVPVIYFRMSKAEPTVKFIDPSYVEDEVSKSLTHVSTINLKITEVVKCLRESIHIGGKPDTDYTFVAEDEEGNKFYSLHPDTDRDVYKNVLYTNLVFSRNLENPDFSDLNNFDHYEIEDLFREYSGGIGHHEEMGDWERVSGREKNAKLHFKEMNKLNACLTVINKVCRERNIEVKY